MRTSEDDASHICRNGHLARSRSVGLPSIVMRNALLLSEPEDATRGYLERHLRDDGFDVLGAAADSEVLELVEQERPTSSCSRSSSCAGGSARASRAARGIATSP